MSHEEDLLLSAASQRDMARYDSLGLIANPFMEVDEGDDAGVECEIAAAGNKLLVAILDRSKEEAPKPLWVEKSGDIPPSYSLRAVAHAEGSLATDDSLNVLYGYVQLFMMRIGLVRATLGVISERLAFRSFDRTLALFIEKVLATPDEDLASYAVLGPERLAAFEAQFSADKLAATEAIFGQPQVERRPELAEVSDLRRLAMEEDVEESETTDEIDATVGDAPGTQQLLQEAAEKMDDDQLAVLDYIVEYTRTHFSPVIARGLRVYRDRGMAALSEELKITKAPRKTLAKIVEFANLRYRKVAFIYDMFENWLEIDQNLRSKLVGSMSDLRWNTDQSAFPVFIAAPGETPELQEAFGQGAHLEWAFSGLLPMQEHPDEILTEVVNQWLASAALDGAKAHSVDDDVLSQLVAEAGGSLSRFVGMAYAAFESAADRGVGELDTVALGAAKAKGAD